MHVDSLRATKRQALTHSCISYTAVLHSVLLLLGELG